MIPTEVLPGDGDTLACAVLNDPDPVDIVASKEYAGDGGGAATFEPPVYRWHGQPVQRRRQPGSPAVFTVEDFPWDGATCDVTENRFHLPASSCRRRPAKTC